MPLYTGTVVEHARSGAPVVVGQFSLDASTLGGTVKFSIVAWVSGITGGTAATAYLFDLTNSERITDAECSTLATAATVVLSPALVVGSHAGELKDSETLYEIRLTLDDSADATDAAHFGQIALKVS